MRKSSVAVLSLSLLLGTSAFALAADAKQTATTDKPAATDSSMKSDSGMAKKSTMKAKMVKGDVASADDAGKSFVVHPKAGADVTLKVNDKTTYTLDSKKAAWSDVKAGATATAWYKNDGTDNWATKVALKSAPAAK